MFRPMKSNLKAANFNGRFLYLGSERDALEGINSHGYEHGPYISRMVGVAHRFAQRRDERGNTRAMKRGK